MSRQNIDYGIDLGTTNSSIARSDDGNVKIFRIEPDKNTIMPSCVYFTKHGQMHVGKLAYNRFFFLEEKNAFGEFKRTMGSDDKYYFSHVDKYFSSEELSAEVLKKLKTSVKDEEFSSVVITVPADFDQVQIEATRRAAEFAGFDYFELLQEPIAASLAFLGENKKIEGVWLVFDLGGGTFDAALVKIEEGIMKVIDNDGDNHLGGKNMDWLLVDEIIIPHLKEEFSINNILQDNSRRLELRRTWKHIAERGKIDLSDSNSTILEPENFYKDDRGIDIDTAIEIKRQEFESLITSEINRAVDICKKLLNRNRLSSSDLLTVLMVGGPTYIPFLRETVKSELCENINVKIDPMTAVAQGAAIFASTRPIPLKKQKRDISKVQLTLAYPPTTVETEVKLGIRVDKKGEYDKKVSNYFIEISKKDKTWTSGKVDLSQDVGVLQIPLVENETNIYLVSLYDEKGNRLESEPKSFSILQGIKLAQAPLTHDIGVSAISKEMSEELMIPIIEKGTPLPAKGKKVFTTSKNIRPGNDSDILRFIIWEGKGFTKPIRNVHMNEIIVSGSTFPSLLPEGSKIEVTIKVDESRIAEMSAYFPYLDETVKQVINPDYTYSAIETEELMSQIQSERHRLKDIQERESKFKQQQESDYTSLSNNLDEQEDLINKGRGDSDRNVQVQKRLNELSEKLDRIEKDIEWPQLLDELNQELEWTDEVVSKFGDEKDENILEDIKYEIEKASESKSLRHINDIIKKLCDLKWKILFNQPGYWVSVLKGIKESFDEIQWEDRAEASILIERGTDILATGQFSKEIKSIVLDLWNLMPEPDREKTKVPRSDIPHVYRNE